MALLLTSLSVVSVTRAENVAALLMETDPKASLFFPPAVIVASSVLMGCPSCSSSTFFTAQLPAVTVAESVMVAFVPSSKV